MNDLDDFKVGDQVIFQGSKAWSRVTVGKVYTVQRLERTNYGDYVRIVMNDGEQGGFYPSDFKLAGAPILNSYAELFL